MSGLRRFVLPVDQPVLLDSDGFLLPVSDGRWSLGAPRLVADLAVGDAPFALLAAGGVGKTTTLRALADVEPAAVFVNVAVLTRDQLQRRIEAVIGEGAGYLDGLDQAAAHDPQLLPWLEQVLVAASAAGARWRLGCRSAAWDSSLGWALRQGMPGFVEWKLLPVDRSAAAEVLTAHGYDGELFVRVLIDAGLGRLSACVSRMLATARYWSETGGLPDGAVKAMEFEVDQLLRETDPRRRPSMPADRALHIAKRLGAFSAFSGTTSLSVEPDDGIATLSASQLPSDPEPTEPNRAVEPADYRDVLGTALFDPASSARMVFRHQTYQEYLAAAYLVDRNAVPGQTVALLGVHTNGVLPTARIGVAAWLAALRPEMVESVSARNALSFASAASAVELPSDSAKSAVITGLLDAAAAEEQQPDWHVDLEPLGHPGLDELLTSRLSAGTASSQELWWIARLAAACGCVGTIPILVEAAQDTRWLAYARRAAAVTVGQLGDDAQRRELTRLLERDQDDEDGEVLAAVIDALYPRLLTTAELTTALRPHRTDLLLGNYRLTLNTLADRIPDDDLSEFAGWFATTIAETNDARSFCDLLPTLVSRLWDEANKRTVCEALARLLVNSEQTGQWYTGQFRNNLPWNTTDVDMTRRRALAVDVAACGDDTWYVVISLGLLIPDDLGWLLNTVLAPGPAQKTLITCVPQLAGNPSSVDAAELILNMEPSHPAYTATSWMRGCSNIAAPECEPQRRIAAEQHAYSQRVAERDAQHKAALAEAIDSLNDDPLSWWRVARLLAHEDEEFFNHDLTTRTWWSSLDSTQHEAIFNAGLRYLDAHQPRTQEWWTEPTVALEVGGPDWAGVHLMATLLRHRPDTIAQLSKDVWQKWIPAIIATWLFTNDHGAARLDLLQAALAVDRDTVTRAALDHLNDLQATGRPLEPYAVYDRLATELRAEFAERLVSGRYSGDIGANLLDIVAQHTPDSTTGDICHRITQSPGHVLATHAWTHLARLDPNAVVDELTIRPFVDDDVAAIAGNLNVTHLDHAHLARAAAFLLDRYSHDDDPPMQSGFVDSSIHRPRETRRRILQQLALEGQVEELERLRQGRSELDQRIIATDLQTARTRQADLALTMTKPRSLLELLRRSDARLIRDDSDLQAVILTQLDALQLDISHNGAFREIWNGNTPQVEDDISDWIRRRLHERLTSGLVIDRELQVTRVRDGGIGTRIDLTATAYTQTHDTARVIIEAKHIDNRELLTGTHGQLITRYLAPIGRRHGIYLTYWITPAQRPSGWSTSTWTDATNLLQTLAEQARSAKAEGWIITPYVLDISQPR